MSNTEFVVDNQGTRDFPYGFVYFGDTRVGFSPGEGVFEVMGFPATLKERQAVVAHLDRVLPGWNNVKVK